MYKFKSIYDTQGERVRVEDIPHLFNGDLGSEKSRLPLVCVSANFNGNGKTLSDIENLTGYIGLDIDIKDNPQLTNPQTDLAKVREYIVLAYTTISGGYRVVFGLSNEITLGNYVELYNGVVEWFRVNTGLKADPKCSNPNRLFFVNRTDYLYFNLDANRLLVTPKVDGSWERGKSKRVVKPSGGGVGGGISGRVVRPRLQLDIESVRVPSINPINYNKRSSTGVYLKVLPVGTFLLRGNKPDLRIGEGNRNNALCRYLLNRVAYSVFNKSIKLTKGYLLEYAYRFVKDYMSEPLPDGQVEDTVTSIYNSYIAGKITKKYLVGVFGVTYGGGYGVVESKRIYGKLRRYIISNGGLTYKDAVRITGRSERTLQRFFSKLFQTSSPDRLKVFVKLVLNEVVSIVNNYEFYELSKLSELLIGIGEVNSSIAIDSS